MILKSARIISPADGIDEVFDIEIRNGLIVYISKSIEGKGINLSGKIITPGLVDMHCHLRTPGFEYKETIETGISSALEGGFTTICPMANTNPVVDSPEILDFITQKSNGINLHQICAITKGLQGIELVDLNSLKAHGAIAFSDDGRPLENMALYKKALLSGELIISHAEDSNLLTDPNSEAVAVARELDLLRKTGGRIHFAHISTRKAISLIRQAKANGMNVTCETAPHYFSFTKEDVTEDGRFKMNPPLRTQDDLMAVIEGLKDDTIDCIATDHAPHSFEEKSRPFDQAPFGIVGFETALGAGITNLVYKGHLSIYKLLQKMSVNPSKILKLQNSIKVGQKANLTIIDPDIEYRVDVRDFKTKCKISPFDGKKLKGKATAVVVNGEMKKTGVQYANFK